MSWGSKVQPAVDDREHAAPASSSTDRRPQKTDDESLRFSGVDATIHESTVLTTTSLFF